MAKKIDKKMSSNVNRILLVAIFLLGVGLVLPVLAKIPAHPDEYQFYENAFRIMAGKELHNYLHVALTEYLVAGFFSLVNMFTASGVNFPQGNPSLVTYYYGRIFGLILYIVTFILGCLILQRREKKIKPRTVIFAILYFSSLGLFERFLRVNSDSMTIFVFFNFVIWSFWLHRQKASALKFFLLNLVFVFLASFTNLKALYLVLPLSLINLISPFIWYENKKENQGSRLPKIYRFILSVAGTFLGGVILWSIFIPKPFNYKIFWYAIKETIMFGTKFDFNYPAVAFGSWKVYIFDTLAEKIGFPALLAIVILFIIAFKFLGKDLFKNFWLKIRNQIKLSYLQEGELEKMTELVLFVSMLTYYIGISTAVIHYSRWAAPMGILAIMILSTFVEKNLNFIWPYKDKIKPRLIILLPILFIFAWVLRISLTADLLKSNYLNYFPSTSKNVDNFLQKEGVKPEEYLKKAAWFGGAYSGNITGALSLEQLTAPQYSEIKYLFWPFWATGQLYTNKNVDLSAHNQIAFINKYAEKIYFRFPTILSHYIYYTTRFAWKFLGITYWPEIINLAENHYGIVKLKEPIKSINLVYEVPFKDMSHYYFPYSLIFNIPNLPDGYMFPPCYGYSDVKYVKDGRGVEPPPGIPQGARTAGLYCHSVRFRMFFKGKYKIRIEGLPPDKDNIQKVYTNLKFDWDPVTKEMFIDMPFTVISGEFGVATKEKNIKNLRFVIFYKTS